MNNLTKPDLRNPLHILAFGFGSGLSPKAPGTFGTLAAIPVFLIINNFNLFIYLIVLSIIIVSGIKICDVASKDLGVHDHPGIVWDEFAGFLITMIAVPSTWQTILIGFVLFRFFDIVKPWPIGWLDKKVSGGFGIMLDDIVAGGMAWLVLQLILGFGWMV